MADDHVGRPLAVAVTTFRRPEQLAALIPLVLEQAVEFGARFYVVDNDPAQTARSVAEDHGITYVCQPVPGIAAARQAALDHAQPDELVVMIDDDVRPQGGWLAGLIACWADSHPAAVMGYVDYVWPPRTDPWVIACGAMRRTSRSTGSVITTLATGNVLLDAAQIRALDVRFALDLGLQGGEDSVFGAELTAAGGRIVACRESVVRDEIPAERATREFARRRLMAQGGSLSTAALRGRHGIARVARRIRLLLGASARLALFTARATFSRARGDVPRNAVDTRRMWVARGRLAGALGKAAAEYARDR